MRSPATIIMILITQISFGQNYLDYYKQVNEAKLLSVDSNYLQSALTYKKTFEAYDFEFARDCINAVEVSTALNHDSLTFYFIKCALKRGVPISYFKQKSELKNFKLTHYWSLIVDNVLLFKKEFESSINTEIRDEINEMFEADQEMRKRYYQWWNFPFRYIIGKKWKTLNHKQVIRLVEITKTHGFPGECLIGIDFPKYHEKIDSKQFSAGMPIIIFIHHYSQPNFSYDSVLLEQVFKGNLYNEHFATICDFEAEFGKGKFDCSGYFGLRHQPKNYKQGEFKEKRKEIGLLLDSEIQKLKSTQILTKFWAKLK